MEIKSKRKKVDVFDIVNQSYWGKLLVKNADKQYQFWRDRGIGVLLDRDGHICIDSEDAEDDGLSYNEQLAETIKNFGDEAEDLKACAKKVK